MKEVVRISGVTAFGVGCVDVQVKREAVSVGGGYVEDICRGGGVFLSFGERGALVVYDGLAGSEVRLVKVELSFSVISLRESKG